MRFNQLDLNLLVALDAILAESSVTKAAERLNLTQSAMSNALSRLRDYFGDELFVQTGRSLRATPLAQSLREPVQRILFDVQASVIDRQVFNPALSDRQFSIAASDYMVRVVLSDFARHLSLVAPHVRLDILPLSGQHIRQKLVSGEVDFLMCPDVVIYTEMPYEILFEEDFVVVACERSARWREGITFTEFCAAGHVVIRLGDHRVAGIDEAVCARAGVERHAEITVGAFDHLTAFVQGTDRIAMLQRGMAQHYAGIHALRLFELPFENARITEVLQWHPCNENGEGHIWFRNLALSYIRHRFGSGDSIYQPK